MEPFNAGWLSIVPPIVAIALALITKEVLSSLVLGILTGTLIYTIGMDGNVLMGTLESAFTVMGNKVDFNILIFCSLLGALVYVVAMSGGTKAYGNWAVKRIKGRKSALAATTGLGALIFIDDYFNCLTVGTVMRPICDRYNIARAKLAYIIDSTAAPVCIIAPVSSWAAAVGSSLQGSTAFESDMAAFIATIPWNFYALLCLLLIVFIVVTDFDFGPMRKSEERAAKGEQFTSTAATSSAEPPNANPHGTLWDMLVPIASLIVFCVLALMYSGGYWGADPKYHTFASALGNSSAAPSLVWASFGAVGIAFLMYVPRGLVPFTDFMSGLVEGMKLMLPANIILVLAWTLSGVCRDFLQTPLFVQSIVTSGGAEWSIFLPAVIFVIAAFLSFSTGTAWHVWHPDPDRGAGCRGHRSGPHRRRALRNARGLRLRRPLLAHFGHDDSLVGRFGMQPHRARLDPDALQPHGGVLRLPGLRGRGPDGRQLDPLDYDRRRCAHRHRPAASLLEQPQDRRDLIRSVL